MEKFLTGIVIKTTDLGEADKILTILTKEEGVVTAILRGAKIFRNKNSAAAQQFAYCKFTMFAGHKGYLVNDIEILELFFGLRNDLKSISLAMYFCELCLNLSIDAQHSEEALRVFLNSLLIILNKKLSQNAVKAIFEMKICSAGGYMPDLRGCRNCKVYEAEKIYFSFREGAIFCAECVKTHINVSLISGVILSILRHIIYAPIEKLFSFKITDEIANIVSQITEKYVLTHVKTYFKTLDFYKNVI